MKKKKSVPRWLQIVSTIIANAAIVLSIIYIVFYILDGFNPMLHFLGEQVFVTRYLDVIIAGIALLLGILFLTVPRYKDKKKAEKAALEQQATEKSENGEQ